MKREA
ncbi:hypothetical protein RDI58_010047 [Solanum bulbocastanum]